MSEFFNWLLGILKEFRFFIVVLPWETMIRCRLGKHVKVWETGWHIRIPFVDTLHVVNSRLRFFSSPLQTVTTKDGHALSVAFGIGFSIVDARSALMKFAQPEHSLSALVQSRVAEFVWLHDLKDIHARELEGSVTTAVVEECDRALQIAFIRLVDFVAAPTMRLLQEQWRPMTDSAERTV
jgi:regulator of protease activity HflC (stomatin/prohibitin superfamily)